MKLVSVLIQIVLSFTAITENSPTSHYTSRLRKQESILPQPWKPGSQNWGIYKAGCSWGSQQKAFPHPTHFWCSQSSLFLSLQSCHSNLCSIFTWHVYLIHVCAHTCIHISSSTESGTWTSKTSSYLDYICKDCFLFPSKVAVGRTEGRTRPLTRARTSFR
jgi:hypothetical protein